MRETALQERAPEAPRQAAGGVCPPSRERPVDLVHLARQTMGDRGLEQEVLVLFMQQLATARERLKTADEPERLMIAHTLKGSARGVGAFGVADCAAAIEQTPQDMSLIDRLAQIVEETRDFIASINR